ncbi:Biopolymer transport protein ExbB [Planctomycetes bacterium Pan216]|uniref:Biopolymer transport protein ExbB n=1 Tax=Kolteria novifilia TaxID=2527975 RepID=A0A518AY49_9BACT|nr:Biopolymer transport protein ExbB [Planctomycetes bacterium Pan216]
MIPEQRGLRRRYWLCSALLLGLLMFSQAAVLAQETESEVPAEAPNFLIYVFQASPTFFFLMLVISVYLVTLVFNNFTKLRLPKVVPQELVANIDAMLTEKRFKEAYEVVKADNSLFARALTAGVERLSHGFDRGMDALMTVAEDGRMEMEHRVSPVATIGAVAPMVGLLGTVLGMILAFQQIAQGGQPRPAELAKDIGLSLVTTLEGIVIAVPAIFFFSLFKNRVARLAFEVEQLGESYLWRFSRALEARGK